MGKVMGTFVLQESARCFNLANLSEREKGDILHVPIIPKGTFGLNAGTLRGKEEERGSAQSVFQRRLWFLLLQLCGTKSSNQKLSSTSMVAEMHPLFTCDTGCSPFSGSPSAQFLRASRVRPWPHSSSGVYSSGTASSSRTSACEDASSH